MWKITYKLKTGEYKSKIVEDFDLPKIQKKMIENKNKIFYWWKEVVYENRDK